MTTNTMSKIIPWGKNVSGITDEVATFFYKTHGWVALKAVQKWANGNNGRVESAHGILERRIQEPLGGPSWQWLTANYEEDTGIDSEGKFGKKGEAVFVAIQGGGIILSSPERLQAAYTNRTPKGGLTIKQDDISRLLEGFLPNEQQIRIYTINELMEEDPAKLPQIYAIVAPIQEFSETPSGTVPVDKLPKNKLFIARAGHPTTAENYAKALERAGVRTYGNRHRLANANPKNPSWRVLRLGNYCNYGLSANYNLYGNARFVGVRQIVGAEGAAPRQVGSLDELVGKAKDLGNGVLVINSRDISPAAYNALTGAKQFLS